MFCTLAWVWNYISIKGFLLIAKYSCKEENNWKEDEDCNGELVRKEESTDNSCEQVGCWEAVLLKKRLNWWLISEVSKTTNNCYLNNNKIEPKILQQFVNFAVNVYSPWPHYPASLRWRPQLDRQHCWKRGKVWGKTAQYLMSPEPDKKERIFLLYN